MKNFNENLRIFVEKKNYLCIYIGLNTLKIFKLFPLNKN